MSETADIARRAVEGGFADPVFDAQAVFASLLQAMSRPGTIVDFGKRCTPPAPPRTPPMPTSPPVHVESHHADAAAAEHPRQAPDPREES